jgi:hypothetical protein
MELTIDENLTLRDVTGQILTCGVEMSYQRTEQNDGDLILTRNGMGDV